MYLLTLNRSVKLVGNAGVRVCRDISPSIYFCPTSSRLRVSVVLHGESKIQWKRIGSDIWQFDKVDLVSKGHFQAALSGRQACSH